MMDESYLVNPSVSHGSLEEDSEERERVPRPVLFIKTIQLIFACGCLAAYASASHAEKDEVKVGFCWATFGSQLIILTSILAGYVIGETTPRLVIVHNGLGGILFTASGAINLDTWWNYQLAMFGIITDGQSDWNADMLLVTGILSLMNASLLYADTVVAIVLWKLSVRNRPWN